MLFVYSLLLDLDKKFMQHVTSFLFVVVFDFL